MTRIATAVAVVVLSQQPSIPPAPQLPTPEFAEEWDERRYIEYISRQGQVEFFQPTSLGPIAELSDRSVVYEVAYDKEWRQAVSQAIMLSAVTEKEPGVWLLCPDGRTDKYMECQVVAQHLRSYGVPLRVRTLTIPMTKENQ